MFTSSATIQWQKEVPFIDLCQSHVRRKYGTPIIEFDGYDKRHSTKDMTHLCRTSCVCPRGNFTGGMPLKSTKEHFLTNHVNSEQADVHYNAWRKKSKERRHTVHTNSLRHLHRRPSKNCYLLREGIEKQLQ